MSRTDVVTRHSRGSLPVYGAEEFLNDLRRITPEALRQATQQLEVQRPAIQSHDGTGIRQVNRPAGECRHGADDRVSNALPGERLGDVGHQQRRLAGSASAHSAIPRFEERAGR